MQELISNAEAIILAEKKIELKPWEQAVVSSCEKVAEAINPQKEIAPDTPTPEEINNLLKNM